MPLLNCTARNCMYNKDEYCSKGDILVEGTTAETADETCCRSFVEKKDGTVNRAETGCACKTIEVDCKACDCSFNTQEKCSADKITIAVLRPADVMIPNAAASQQNKNFYGI